MSNEQRLAIRLIIGVTILLCLSAIFGGQRDEPQREPTTTTRCVE